MYAPGTKSFTRGMQEGSPHTYTTTDYPPMHHPIGLRTSLPAAGLLVQSTAVLLVLAQVQTHGVQWIPSPRTSGQRWGRKKKKWLAIEIYNKRDEVKRTTFRSFEKIFFFYLLNFNLLIINFKDGVGGGQWSVGESESSTAPPTLYLQATMSYFYLTQVLHRPSTALAIMAASRWDALSISSARAAAECAVRACWNSSFVCLRMVS